MHLYMVRFIVGVAVVLSVGCFLPPDRGILGSDWEVIPVQSETYLSRSVLETPVSTCIVLGGSSVEAVRYINGSGDVMLKVIETYVTDRAHCPLNTEFVVKQSVFDNTMIYRYHRREDERAWQEEAYRNALRSTPVEEQ